MNTGDLNTLKKSLSDRLKFIYENHDTNEILERTLDLISKYEREIKSGDKKWDEKEVVLITYGDSIVKEGEKSLKTLERFSKNYFDEAVSLIHILPFFPYSSDDGFSVIDYYKVREDLGNWDDIESLKKHFDLAADLVINHISSKSKWFQNFLQGKDPGKDYFITENPDKDLSKVVRPRSTPLLTPFETTEGKKYVWTTFSDDQIDLDFHNPEVFLEMFEILLFYLSKGIRVIRMDAIAFLWKEAGTSCLHLPQTHEVVKLYRDVFDYLGPDFVLLTETNVPNKENLSYFGDGDEANMIYQFSLPPLLLYSFFAENSHFLNEWGSTLPEPPEEATFFNFTASHDGIGVRPLEGIVPEKQKQQLFENVKNLGGKISTKSNSDGSTSPYEMNITYLDALKNTKYANEELQVQRFISSQTVMAAFKGVPAFYIHSLLGTTNDYEGYEQTGRARSLNRKRWNEREIGKALESENLHREVLEKLKQMISVRKQQPAFHPEAKQVWHHINDDFIAFRRVSEKQEIFCITNVTSRSRGITVESSIPVKELLTNDKLALGYSELQVMPFDTIWLSSEPNCMEVYSD